MPSITLKDIPADLHAQLAMEAETNYRSMAQEVFARLQRSFDLDDRFTAAKVNRLIAEAVASGPEAPVTPAGLAEVRERARREFTKRRQAA
jgi:hypothetical protein